jgi:polysaccharide export outer membrane protein
MLGAAAIPASAQDTAAANVPPAVQSLRPGDVVRITVWRQPELSGEFRITADGAIAHPLYQSVDVKNVTLAEATSRIRQYLTQLTNDPQVVIEPLLSVAVGGEVRQPGLYNLPLGTTLSQAVAQAGGGSDESVLKRVRLIRGARQVIIDLTDTKENRGAMPVRSGDQIFLERRGNAFRDIIGPMASILGAAAAIISVSRK